MAETSEAVSNELAALDLGSNSFHLIVARHQNGRVQIIDRLKEMVRLAGGIDENGNLSPAAMERALASLSRISQRLQPLAQHNVRVVGTNTLRRARNVRTFIARAEATLGHRIEVISGREEARLIYAGVCYALAPTGEGRFVVDIGGGSTELILGRDRTPHTMESLHMGCVSFSERFFPEGRIRPRRFEAALLAARQELEPLEATFRARGWDTAIGASGTVLAIRDVAAALGQSSGDITMTALGRIKRELLQANDVTELELPELAAERAQVLPGGLAILTAVMTALGIERLHVSDAALREGLLLDLIGRAQQQDQRDRSIEDLARRYHVDLEHANRVRETAAHLLGCVSEAWRLTDPQWAKLLGWAAITHEIGTDIAHNQYHKHGYYLLLNMDLSGFSKDDQRRLALLVRSHRRKFPIAEFTTVPNDERDRLMRLAALLRIAVVLRRNRTADSEPPVTAVAADHELKLTFASHWLDSRPLTSLDLAQEQDYLAALPLTLSFAGMAELAVTTD